MEFISYQLTGSNTASLNTGSYLTRTDSSMFVNGFTPDIWFGFSANDTVEVGVWDRDENLISWATINQSKSYNAITLSYTNTLDFPVTYSYRELIPDFILYKSEKVLVSPSDQISSSFQIQSGSYFLTYNFVREMAGTPIDPLVIKEISPSRKELKLVPISASNPSYVAFCEKKVLITDIAALYIQSLKACPYSQIFAQISPLYPNEISTIQNVFFINTEGGMVDFFKHLYEDLIIFTSIPKVSATGVQSLNQNLIRIQGIQTYFNNFLLSNSETIVDFSDIDNQFQAFTSASIERKFKQIGPHPSEEYVKAKAFVYDFFTKYFYTPIANVLSSTYKEKYFSHLRNALNLGGNRLLPVVNTGLMDERVAPTDPLTLLVKLQTELPDDIMVHTTCWVSNVSLTPYVVSAILQTPTSIPVFQIGPPNFSIPIPNASLTNTNKSYDATDLQEDDATDRELTVSKNIEELAVDYTDFNNFVIFSSAELRLKIFKNKVISLNSLTSSLVDLNASNVAFIAASGSTYPFYNQQVTSIQSQINDVINSFDGYESYLYRSGLYDYQSGSFVSASAIADLDSSASVYDTSNQDSLVNNCPEHILTNPENDDYIIFLSMIGHFFDNIFIYIANLPSQRKVGNSATEEFTRRVVDYMLETFGWNVGDSLEQTGILNNYLTSDQQLGLNNLSAEDRLKTVRNRILTNLPQIYKTKGTEEAVRLILACYGIPSSLLSIREYGGINYLDEKAAYTTYERTYLRQWDTSSALDNYYLQIPPENHTYLCKVLIDSSEPYTYNRFYTLFGSVENPSGSAQNVTGSGEWAVGFVRVPKQNTGKMWFRIGYIDRPSFLMYSPEFPLFDGNVYSVMLRRNNPDIGFEFTTNTDAIPSKFDLVVQRNEFGNNIVYVSSSQICYDSASQVRFTNNGFVMMVGWFAYWNAGGSSVAQGYTGCFDKFQVWHDPLTDSNFDDYANNINGYSFSGSNIPHESLIFRMHTDYPENQRQEPSGSSVPNIYSISATDWTGQLQNANPFYAASSSVKLSGIYGIGYNVDVDYAVNRGAWIGAQKLVYSSASCSYVSESCYPFQYRVVDYPNTWNISKYGPNKFRNEKVRYVSQSVEARFDDKERSTFVSANTTSPDSNQVGFFVDPQDFKNRDIIRYFGNHNFMDDIGDPSNQFSSSYDILRYYRAQYAAARNEFSGSRTLFGELCTLFKLYFNRSVFDAIKNVVPARTNTFVGVLVEPTVIERPKYESKPVFSENNSGSVLYFDITASHYFRDPNTKLVRLTESIDFGYSASITASYINLPNRDYPVNYGGNYISDIPDKFELGHFAGGLLTNEELQALLIYPEAQFVATPTLTTTGSSILFTNQSLYATSYAWNFGDGSPVSNDLNPVHTYGATGFYTVTLVAYGSGLQDTESKVSYITISNAAPIVANFTATPTTGNATLAVTFTNLSTGASIYTWNFGDGGTSTSTNPVHNYTAAGLYTVTLIASNGIWQGSKISASYINVGNTPPPPPPPPPPSGGGGCLLAGTKIRMADGTIKNVEDIQVGDMLLSMTGWKVKVLQLMPNRYDRYYILNDRLRITWEHPIIVIRQGQAVQVETKDVEVGEQMLRYDGSFEKLVSKVEVHEETPTFNFKVDGNNLYIADDIVVHNPTTVHKY